MVIIPITSLPSHFKPYTFKHFRMKGITIAQALELGDKPSIMDCRNLLCKLIEDADAACLVPIDVQFLIATLAFNAYPNQSWSLQLTCPHCRHTHTITVKASDFPDIPSFEESDPYPLTVDDGTHVYELGYAPCELYDTLDIDKPLDYIAAHVLTVDGSPDNVPEKIREITNFAALSTMAQAIAKYFVGDTYTVRECPKCNKNFRVALSAVEVTQYTPFLDKEASSQCKINFRL